MGRSKLKAESFVGRWRAELLMLLKFSIDTNKMHIDASVTAAQLYHRRSYVCFSSRAGFTVIGVGPGYTLLGQFRHRVPKQTG